MPKAAATWLTARPSTKCRRSISYLTCTRSRGSKNSSVPPKASSRTLCGRGWSAPASRRAAALESSGGWRGIFVNVIIYDNPAAGQGLNERRARASAIMLPNRPVVCHLTTATKGPQGRILGDTRDEIRLTLLRRRSSLLPRVDQVRQQQQVLHAQPRAASTNAPVGIEGYCVGPICRHRACFALGAQERHSFLAPQLLSHYETE